MTPLATAALDGVFIAVGIPTLAVLGGAALGLLMAPSVDQPCTVEVSIKIIRFVPYDEAEVNRGLGTFKEVLHKETLAGRGRVTGKGIACEVMLDRRS